MKISVVGLGKLGAPLAALLASKGHEVVGADLNARAVDAVNRGAAPVEEPGLQDRIDGCEGRLRATVDIEEAAEATEVTFVIVPTPSTSTGEFSCDLVLAAVERVAAGIRRKDGYHVVTVTSTVMPGHTGGVIRRAIEAASGRTVGVDLGLCYNPEFIALGSVIADMLRPDFVLIGESDRRAGDVISGIHESVCENAAPVRRMGFVNAELTKIAVNTFVTTKISYANMLGDICDRLPGADVDVVTDALGADKRIGPKYLRAATAYGGPCFPRDNVAFSALAHSVGARPDLAEATDRINAYQVDRLASIVASRVSPGSTVAILGLAYKPSTPVTEESVGVALARALAEKDYAVTVYDPLAMANAERELSGIAKCAESMADCVGAADFVVIATAWPEFAGLDPGDVVRPGKSLPVLDCWRVLDSNRMGNTVEVIHLGRGNAHAS